MLENILVRELIEKVGTGVSGGIVIIDAIYLGAFQQNLCPDFHGAQRRGSISGEERTARSTGEQHYPLFLEVPDGPPADKRFGHLIHAYGRLNARFQTKFLQRSLQRKAIDHRGKHPHVVRAGRLNSKLVDDFLPAENVPSSHHKADLDSVGVHLHDLLADAADLHRVNTERVRSLQGLARQLQQYPLERRHGNFRRWNVGNRRRRPSKLLIHPL
ncbi:MAG: hypothetical protein BWY06_01714 [Candidatus Latescibacteria bacterium ADurb.Bin168]|nr:MAG: hypothetical protein BWY06_01714 [Candidatus Latescibacteria bacterium ADurb.Bin168]